MLELMCETQLVQHKKLKTGTHKPKYTVAASRHRILYLLLFTELPELRDHHELLFSTIASPDF